jgi:hypothetical protein
MERRIEDRQLGWTENALFIVGMGCAAEFLLEKQQESSHSECSHVMDVKENNTL